MKYIEFYDQDGNKLSVQHSSLATEEAFRIYLKGDQFTPQKDSAGRDIPVCLHLTRNQAEMLIHALQDLFED